MKKDFSVIDAVNASSHSSTVILSDHS